MTDKEKMLAGKLLEMASDEFSNHGCNDLPKELERLLTQEEWDRLNKEMHDWNGDPEEYRPGQVMSYDWLWMSFLGAKLRGEVK